MKRGLVTCMWKSDVDYFSCEMSSWKDIQITFKKCLRISKIRESYMYISVLANICIFLWTQKQNEKCAYDASYEKFFAFWGCGQKRWISFMYLILSQCLHPVRPYEMWMGEEDKYRTLIDLQGIRPCAKIVHEETSLSHETLPYIRYLCLCA